MYTGTCTQGRRGGEDEYSRQVTQDSWPYPMVCKAGSKTLSGVKPVFGCVEIRDDGAEARVGERAGALARIKASGHISIHCVPLHHTFMVKKSQLHLRMSLIKR